MYDFEHDFEPLKSYLKRNPEQEGLPWEYMGEDGEGRYFYRERWSDQRLCLVDGGRYGAVHQVYGGKVLSVI